VEEGIMEESGSKTEQKLKLEFVRFQNDPLQRFVVKLRRERAGQLRRLLSNPNSVDSEIFNREVWALASGAYLRGEDVKKEVLGELSQERAVELEGALDVGNLELHGNYVWRPAGGIYGPKLANEDQRTENIRRAIVILNDPTLIPLEKARRIEGISGFGPNTATGLTMLFHPGEFAIYNKQSQGAMEKLKRDASNLDGFEQAAQDLKELLGAQDFLELDWFLYLLNQEKVDLNSKGVEGVEALVGRGPLNIILYGPPGTGKTYSVQRRALRILRPDLEDLSDAKISELYRKYLEEERIEFVTFHPSYSYEEFIEGYRYDEKAKVPTLHDGVFKRLVTRALEPTQSSIMREDAQIWKILLGKPEEHWIFKRCIDNGEIAIGWYPDWNLEGFDKEDIATLFEEDGREKASNDINSVNYLVNEMREGDYVAVFASKRTIRAIGRITGGYQYKAEEYGHDLPHIRPVEWIDHRTQDIVEVKGGEMDRKTITPLHIPLDKFELELLPQTKTPYVLIIDEINRGNLSRIFGELITLLEEDKRRGAPNELSARLPYSGKTFTVPSNLVHRRDYEHRR